MLLWWVKVLKFIISCLLLWKNNLWHSVWKIETWSLQTLWTRNYLTGRTLEFHRKKSAADNWYFWFVWLYYSQFVSGQFSTSKNWFTITKKYFQRIIVDHLDTKTSIAIKPFVISKLIGIDVTVIGFVIVKTPPNDWSGSMMLLKRIKKQLSTVRIMNANIANIGTI